MRDQANWLPSQLLTAAPLWTLSVTSLSFLCLQSGSKRHRKLFKDSLKGISKPALRRLARRAGCKRVSAQIYEDARTTLKNFVEVVVYYALAFKDVFGRKTVSLKDVNLALKKRGYLVYGAESKRKKGGKKGAKKGKKAAQ